MTHLLIVDDEPLAVRAVQNTLDWDKLGISKISTAYNAAQAKDIINAHTVEIMLCDIEMPQESGIELLAWVREHSPDTAFIFLTCHADFGFAQKAVQLGSLDYLLKPIPTEELEAAIRKAIKQISKDHEVKRYSQSWVKHHPLFIERFWNDILNRAIPSNTAAILAAAMERNIYIPDKLNVLPILIQLKRWHKPLSPRDEKIMEYALINSLKELIDKAEYQCSVVAIGRGQLLAILQNVQDEQKNHKELMQAYISSCYTFFFCDITCYVGVSVPIEELSKMTNQLTQLQKENVTSDNQVILFQDTKSESDEVPRPDMKVWQLLLEEGSTSNILQEMNRYFDRLQSKAGISSVYLNQFVQDVLQIVYSLLNSKGIQAHQLFQDPMSVELLERATSSLADLRQWVKHLMEKALSYAFELKKSGSVVDKAKNFIINNLDQDLNRESISAPFYLHPDYLNRLFKKECGMSMTEFLLEERMRTAKELLRKTEQPVTSIATRVGYSNLSHFAKLFRKYTGLNPIEYRHTTNEASEQ